MSVALGAWLMVAPAIFQIQGQAAHSDHILSALVIVLSIPPGKIKNTYDNWNPLMV